MFPEGRALEFLIAATVALIVVGPKDLPGLLRKLGQFMAKVRGMAAEFRASFDEMARQSELDELRKEVDAMRQAQLNEMTIATSHAEVSQTFDDLQHEMAGAMGDTGSSHAAATDTAAPARKPRARRAASAKAATVAPAKSVAKSAPTTKASAKPRRRKSPGPTA